MDEIVVEFVDVDGELHAAVTVDDVVGWQRLAHVRDVGVEVAALRFATRRLVLRRGSARSLAVARAAAAHAAAHLDATLLAPWATLLGDRGLIVVPTPILHGLPWPMLPTCRGRPLTVSLRGQRAAAGRVPDGRCRPPGQRPSVLLVAAPSPPRARAEVTAIARGRPDATVLIGAQARITAVRAALNQAEVVHLAAHGAPSYLSLVDGPLGIAELARARPQLMVLSACDAGLSAAALLRRGLPRLVASVGVVDDAGTDQLMVDLHRRLGAGDDAATALARAQSAFPELSGAYGFICFG